MGQMLDVSMDGVDSATVGAAALGAAKAAKEVAMQAAAYDQELAKHATYASQEMDEMSRSVSRYILGTSVTTIDDVDPYAGQIEHTPPEYSSYAYPTGMSWSTYPAPVTRPSKIKRESEEIPAAIEASLGGPLLLLPL